MTCELADSFFGNYFSRIRFRILFYFIFLRCCDLGDSGRDHARDPFPEVPFLQTHIINCMNLLRINRRDEKKTSLWFLWRVIFDPHRITGTRNKPQTNRLVTHTDPGPHKKRTIFKNAMPYSGSNFGYYLSEDGTTMVVSIREGVTQGCNFGTLLFNLRRKLDRLSARVR